MNDLETQLRDAMNAAVADAEAPPALMHSVRRRNRRRRMRGAIVTACLLALAAAAVPAVAELRGPGRPPVGTPRRAPIFPGGGRLLVASARALTWLYPDGRRVIVAPDLGGPWVGAAIYGSKLVAWQYAQPCRSMCYSDADYYTMNLDGSDITLVLPAEHEVGGVGFYHAQVQLSPDGSMLGYVRQANLRGGGTGPGRLWSIDLATGRKFDLGPFASGRTFRWRSDTTMLADSADGRALDVVNARTGASRTYLTIRTPALAAAYERVRPHSGPPASVGLIGFSAGADPHVLAVSVAGSGSSPPRPGPVLALILGNRVLGYAPNDRPAIVVVQGPRGMFLLATGAGDNPGSWENGTFAGNARSSRLAAQPTFGEPWDTAAFSPDGSVIAYGYGGGPIAFVPLTSPVCRQAARCLNFAPKPLFGLGTLLAWAP